MKKLVIFMGALLVAVSAYSQGGYVSLQNTSSRGLTNWVTGQRMTSADNLNVVCMLVYGTATNDLKSATPEQFRDDPRIMNVKTTTMSATPGMFTTVSPFAVGGGYDANNSYALMQIQVWSKTDPDTGATINSIAEARATGKANVFWGYSIVMVGKLGQTSSGAFNNVVNASPSFPGMWVYPAPKPSTLALGALGLLGVYFIRRRK